jgi:glutamate N-acetyltransferase/amino-acid N-acetyltransferase
MRWLLVSGSAYRCEPDPPSKTLYAVSKAGEAAGRDRLSIWLGGSERDPAYDEAQVSAAMKKPEISLKVTLGLGRGRDRC